MTKVAVVDDHGVVLAGLKFVLSRAEGMQVVATAESAEDILGFYEENKPDILLLDIRMPVVSGLDALEAIRRAHPHAKVAMLTTSELEEDIFRELSILQLAAKVFSNPEVGEMLGISVNSVKTHFRHIFEKMDVSDRMEAVTLAISRGIIES